MKIDNFWNSDYAMDDWATRIHAAIIFGDIFTFKEEMKKIVNPYSKPILNFLISPEIGIMFAVSEFTLVGH